MIHDHQTIDNFQSADSTTQSQNLATAVIGLATSPEMV